MNKLLIITIGLVFSNWVQAFNFKLEFLTPDNNESHTIAINDNNQIIARADNKPIVWADTGITYLGFRPGISFVPFLEGISNSGDVLIRLRPENSTALVPHIWSTVTNTITVLDTRNRGIVISDYDESGKILGAIYYQHDPLAVVWESPYSQAENVLFPANFNANVVNGIGQYGGRDKLIAAIYDGEKVIDIGTLGGRHSFIKDLSDTGYAIGESEVSEGVSRNFVWKDGEMHMLPSLSYLSDYTHVFAVNDYGFSVGDSGRINPGENNSSHAVLWNHTNVIDLNNYVDTDIRDAGWILTSAIDINNNGWITGNAFNSITNELQAYVLKPEGPIPQVPEPTTWAMLLAGLGMLGFLKNQYLTNR